MLPVVAPALLAGVVRAVTPALARAAALPGLSHGVGVLSRVPMSVPLAVQALGSTAALPARPRCGLRQRRKLVEAFSERADPRQGLLHHVSTLLEQLASHFGLRSAAIGLHGPEPRIFEWRAGARTRVLSGPEAARWGERMAVLPRDAGCIGSSATGVAVSTLVTLGRSGHDGGVPVDGGARQALAGLGSQTLALPLMSYGQPFGTLCLIRDAPAFTATELHWIDAVMRETLPLLERSDLLEQLQRRTVQCERIGRDLHDSAVQPYLGLKYGLEALAWQAGPGNPLAAQIAQLVSLTSDELERLRDVISGLRRGDGDDPAASDSASLAALQRQTQRFASLYGLKVHISVPPELRLRSAAAKALLHMVNEALTNVRRHTAATAVDVQLEAGPDGVRLRVRNDHVAGQPPRDFLPLSLAGRAAELGGDLRVELEPDATVIVITLPLRHSLGWNSHA